ncbi:aminopeptidase N-like [Pogonomyrmex barbatus]|uniref:Aminopeptidase N-like n=1 Tax=Pogonomyrmex barbatus TaxID=144034 RepID=A0A8N1S329_9HYME|nr:aminopeptidase N-like [Pogonomyrmex barbatus]
MNPWIQEKQYPILSVAEIFGSEWTKIFLQTASENWTVPLTHQVYINLKRILPTFCLWEQKHFLTTCYNSEHSRFIIINRQQTGYYRVHYDFESWLGIINYLNSKNYANINVLNRAQIIDDTFHLAISGKLNFYVFWDVVSYLKWETDYIPWYPMFKAAEYMSHILPFYNADNIIFKKKLRMQLGPLLQKIGYEEESNDDMFIKCLRQEALRWACILGDSKCKKHAEYKLQWHLLNPIKNKLLPWWREWTFCNGLCVSSISLDQLFIDLDKMNITKLIKLLLYGSLLNYVMALYQHKENVFHKFKINNKQINRPKTTRTRRSEVIKITKEITSNDTHSYIHQMSETVRVRLLNLHLPDFIKPKNTKLN